MVDMDGDKVRRKGPENPVGLGPHFVCYCSRASRSPPKRRKELQTKEGLRKEGGKNVMKPIDQGSDFGVNRDHEGLRLSSCVSILALFLADAGTLYSSFEAKPGEKVKNCTS